MSQRLNFYSRYNRTKNPKDLDSLYHLIEGLDLDAVINDELVQRVSYLKEINLEQKDKNHSKLKQQQQQIHYVQGRYVLSQNSPKKGQKQTHYIHNNSNKGKNYIIEEKSHSKLSSLDKNGQKTFNTNFTRMQKIKNSANTYQQILQRMNTSRDSKKNNISPNKGKNGHQNSSNGNNNKNLSTKKVRSDQILITSQQQEQDAQSPRFKKINQQQQKKQNEIISQNQGEKSSSPPINLVLLQQQIQRQMNKFQQQLASNRNQRLLLPSDKQFKKDKDKTSNFDDQNLSEGMAQLVNVDKIMNSSYNKKPQMNKESLEFQENWKSEILNRQIFSNSDQSSIKLADSRNKQDFQNLQPTTHNIFNQNKIKINIAQSQSEDQSKVNKNGLFNKKTAQSPGIKIPYKGLSQGTWPTQKSIENNQFNQISPKSVQSKQTKNKQINEESPLEKERKPFKKVMMDRKIQPKMTTSTFVNEVVAVTQTVEALKNGVIKTNQTFKAIVTVKPFQYMKSVQTMKSIQSSESKQPIKQNINKPNDSIKRIESKQSTSEGKDELKKIDQHQLVEQPKTTIKKVNFKKVVRRQAPSENNKESQKQVKNTEKKIEAPSELIF